MQSVPGLLASIVASLVRQLSCNHGFVQIFWIWESNFSPLSIWTPGSVTASLTLILNSLFTINSSILACCLLASKDRNLLVLAVMWLWLNHSMHFIVFIFTNSLSSSILLAETVIVLLSAKLHKDLLLVVRKISFIKILKKSGRRIEPGGTPWFREPHVLMDQPSFTDYFLSEVALY